MAKPIDLRIKAMEIVRQGKTIREATRTCGVSIWTIRRWLKLYEAGGLARLSRIPPWNITPDNIIKKVYLLKEQNPKITLAQARKELLNKGIQFSLEGIRKIWHRYGLAGYDKKRQIAEIIPKMSFSKDVKREIEDATRILEQKGEIKGAAKILNRLPYCGGSEILDKIPCQYLGLRRKVEKIPFLAGKERLDKFYQRVHSLRLRLEKRRLFYSSLRVGLTEADALFWLGRPKQMLALITVLTKRMPGQGDSVLSFILNLLKGMALARLLKLGDALDCANECKRLTKRLSDASFHMGLGNLYSNVGLYLQAKENFEKAIGNGIASERDACLLSLAGCYALSGEYQKALKTIRELEQKESSVFTFIPLVRAQALLGKGMLMEAAQYAKTAIEVAKKNEVLQYLHTSTMVLSAVYCALGEKERAKSLNQTLIPLLKKNRMMQDYYIRKLILSKNRPFILETYKNEPFIKLILLMKRSNQTLRLKDYNYALRFAIRKGLIGYFHRLCLFNAEVIMSLIEKGKSTGLPRAILKFPIFNQKEIVYHIKFLGSLIIYKNQQYLKVKLKPKDKAFLIYLVSAAAEIGKSIRLEDIYRNFWTKSEKAPQNLSHLLVRVKKALQMPAHLLTDSTKTGYPSLINNGIYFTADYQEFEHTIVQAKALERAGEWDFARKQYLRAFKLFRGEPFKKNYDEWSLNMRHRILTRFESESLSFASSCMKHNNEEDARRVLGKVSRIIPHSDEITDMLKKQCN